MASSDKGCTGRGGQVDFKVAFCGGVCGACSSNDELTKIFVSDFTDKWVREIKGGPTRVQAGTSFTDKVV